MLMKNSVCYLLLMRVLDDILGLLSTADEGVDGILGLLSTADEGVDYELSLLYTAEEDVR